MRLGRPVERKGRKHHKSEKEALELLVRGGQSGTGGLLEGYMKGLHYYNYFYICCTYTPYVRTVVDNGAHTANNDDARQKNVYFPVCPGYFLSARLFLFFIFSLPPLIPVPPHIPPPLAMQNGQQTFFPLGMRE